MKSQGGSAGRPTDHWSPSSARGFPSPMVPGLTACRLVEPPTRNRIPATSGATQQNIHRASCPPRTPKPYARIAKIRPTGLNSTSKAPTRRGKTLARAAAPSHPRKTATATPRCIDGSVRNNTAHMTAWLTRISEATTSGRLNASGHPKPDQMPSRYAPPRPRSASRVFGNGRGAARSRRFASGAW